MTNAMGDTQDLFLEQLRHHSGRLEYLADGQWLPTQVRSASFRIKDGETLQMQLHATRHGPLINAALGERHHGLQPLSFSSRYGLALQRPDLDGDRSLDGFIGLSKAQDLQQAAEETGKVRSIALNMLYADAEHIGWQVTGKFPYRRAGRGLLPSPGWNSQYDWDGYADNQLHPWDQDPPAGWLGTANQRTAEPGYGVQLSASWYYPERSERIAQLAEARPLHDLASMQAMQLDQYSPLVAKVQAMLASPLMAPALQQAITALPAAERQRATQALQRISSFDSILRSDSADAAIYQAFLQRMTIDTFADELGGTESPAWQALVDAGKVSYSAQADHLLGRDDSPFWDDRSTVQIENKPAILARSLAGAITLLQDRLGSDPAGWQWGKLHQYHWQTDGQRLAPWLGTSRQMALGALDDYLGVGPLPAGGDHSTLNAAGWKWGGSFDAFLIPAMRMLVDFSAPEPLMAINSTGQSGNPASRHYRDGNQAWLQGRYIGFPFSAERLDARYGSQRRWLNPAQDSRPAP